MTSAEAVAASLSYPIKVLSPFGRELLGTLVVSGQPVDTRLDQNQTVLGILVLLALLQVLSDADGLPDEAMDVLRDLRSTA